MNPAQPEHENDEVEFHAGKCDRVQHSQSAEPALVVAHQAAEPGFSGEGALHHPVTREEDEAARGLGQRHHIQSDALGGRIPGGRVPCIALVHEGNLHRVSGRCLASRRQRVSTATCTWLRLCRLASS